MSIFTGSDKQIEWANKILEGVTNKMWSEVETASIRVENKSMPFYWASCVYDARQYILDFLIKRYGLKARNWIDNRYNIEVWSNKLNDLAADKYKKIQEIYGNNLTLDQYREFEFN